MADKEMLALSLQQARDSLESSLQQTLRIYEKETGKPLDLRLDLTKPDTLPEEASDRERNLHGTIRTLVNKFHQHPAVSESGIRVRNVTAMDSDADGTAAVNVSYEYPV